MVRAALSIAVLLACVTLGAALPASAAPRAGVAAAVRGKVTLERESSVGIAVQTGAQIYLGDRIATGPEGGLQVLLLDESVFTLGPSSTLVVDRFVYDPRSDRGELQTELVRGAFRFVSGRIAKRDPTQMNVKLPAGTIGVRGTIVGASVDASTGRSLIWLAGPGAGNSAGIAAGSIAVENAGVTREVERSGWGVEIPDFTTPPSPPFQVPDTAYGTLPFEVAPKGGAAKGDDADSEETSTSGQDAPPGAPPAAGSTPVPQADAPADAPLVGPLELIPGGGEPALDGQLAASFQQQLGNTLTGFDALNQDQAQMTFQDAGNFTPTSLAQLDALSASFDGHFLFALPDVPLASGMGELNLFVDLDFEADVVGVQVFGVRSSQLLTLGNGAGATSVGFSSGIGGDARFVAQLSYFETGAGLCVNGCPVSVKAEFLNIPTQVAGQLVTSATLSTVSTIVDETVPQSVPISLIVGPETMGLMSPGP